MKKFSNKVQFVHSGSAEVWLLEKKLRWFAQTDGRTDRQMDGQKICPFYRTLSPIGAAAQKGKDRERPTDTDRDPARLTKTDKEKLVTKLMILFF